MIDANWARWVKSSAYKNFASLNRTDVTLTKITTDNIIGKVPLHVEGEERSRDNRTGQDTESYIELKMDGPHIMELTKGEFKFDVQIHQVITAMVDEDDLYAYDKIKGLAMAMHRDFSVFKLGNGPNDVPDEILLCLQFRQDAKCPLDVRDYGRVDQNTRILQGTITGCYRAYLTE